MHNLSRNVCSHRVFLRQINIRTKRTLSRMLSSLHTYFFVNINIFFLSSLKVQIEHLVQCVRTISFELDDF